MGQLGCDGHDERRAGDNFLSRSSTEIWLPNAPTTRQARIENIIKGQPEPTSYAKQRVSADNSVVDSFFVFFSKRMLEHVVVLLSTMHLSNGTFGQTPKKLPEVINFYNKTKGGVDCADQMIDTRSAPSSQPDVGR